MVEDGDVVEIDYIGRVQNTGDIFDLTSEDVAEEEGYDTEDMDLGPMKVVVGAGHVIDGLDAALKDMDAGERREISIASDDAFGERSSDKVETIAKREFDEYDVPPRRGLVVEIDGQRGKIISTSSGRVRVDFNHPLAGKDLEYEVEILRVIDDPVEGAEAVLAYYGLDELDIDLSYDDGALTVDMPDEVQNEELQEQLKNELAQVKGIDAVTVN